MYVLLEKRLGEVKLRTESNSAYKSEVSNYKNIEQYEATVVEHYEVVVQPNQAYESLSDKGFECQKDV